MCVLTLKSSHRPNGKMPCPHGKMADMPKSTLIFQFGSLFGSIRHMYVPDMPANFPSPRWDFHMFCAYACLQGGGIFVQGGTVTFSSCTITGNTASAVRAHVQNFPSPRWENALPRWDFHMPRALCFQAGGVYLSGGTVTFSSCTITGNTADYVRAHPQNFLGMRAYVQKFPSPRWEYC